MEPVLNHQPPSPRCFKLLSTFLLDHSLICPTDFTFTELHAVLCPHSLIEHHLPPTNPFITILCIKDPREVNEFAQVHIEVVKLELESTPVTPKSELLTTIQTVSWFPCLCFSPDWLERNTSLKNISELPWRSPSQTNALNLFLFLSVPSH